MRLVGLLLTALAGLVGAQTTPITFIHTNDIHSRVEPAIVRGKPFGGYARTATLIRQLRASSPNPLVLNAGDSFQGTLYFNVYRGMADALLMNLSGYQAMALGNHEFDDGPGGLAPFLRAAQFPALSANLDLSAEPQLRGLVQPSVVLRVGRERVGVIGLITEDLPNIASPGPNVRLRPLDASLQTEVTKFKSQGINKIVVLSHLGYSIDLDLAKRHPEVDLIIGGHSHTFLGDLKIEGFPAPRGPYPTLVGPVRVVQAWQWGKVVGRITLHFDRAGRVVRSEGAPVPVDETITPDATVQSAIDALVKPIEQLKAQVVGTTERGLSRDGSPESPMGNLIADAQLAFAQRVGARVAFMNSGGIRASIEPGPITYDEAITVQPFANTLVVLDVTGADIKAMLEVAAARGQFVQVSKGFAYVINRQAPEGSRISAMTLNGTALDLSATYRIVVNSFMARGGDGYTSLAEAKGYRYDTGFIDLDALLELLKQRKPVEQGLEGRIRFAN